MKIYIGADHRGFEKKNMLVKFLRGQGYEVFDQGTYNFTEGDDFNDPAVAVSKNVRDNAGSLGILLCGSAHGMTIQANRFKRIRAAHCDSTASAVMAREHDNCNILCLSAQSIEEDKMQDIVTTFLTTEFEPLERRVNRIKRLDERNDYA